MKEARGRFKISQKPELIFISVAWQLEHEGIKLFTDAFDRAHRELEEKRRQSLSEPAAA